MKKSLNISIVFWVSSLFLSLVSCGDDNSSNYYDVSEEWIKHQDDWVEKVKEASREGLYTPIKSESGLGYIYTRPSDFITNNMAGDFDKDGPEAIPESKSVRAIRETIYETDSLEVRYEGWYYNLDDKKVIFDTTESGSVVNGGQSRSFRVNGTVDGFKTTLLAMKVGEERIVCIPYKLGYGAYGNSNISGYTTLFFDVKILRNIRAEEEAGDR